MADPKYANLPGIAYDQPDVYETSDLPEVDQANSEAPDEIDSVEKITLSANDAYEKFKGKSLDASKVDFSDRIGHQRRIGYDAFSGDHEFVGHGSLEPETPLQKYQRLQLEIKELTEEVSNVKEKSKGDSKETTNAVEIAKQAEELHKQLQNLKLEQILGTELLKNLNDPQGVTQKKLLTDLESFKQVASSQKSSVKEKKGSEKAAPSDQIVYELHYKPEMAKFNQTSNIAEMEQRLQKLESIIGGDDDKLAVLASDTNRRSILGSVSVLNSKLNLLDPAHIDHVEANLAALSLRLTQLADKKAIIEDAEKLNKVSELYALLKNTETVSAELPEIVDRMVVLKELHEQALQFSSALSQLDLSQQQVTVALKNNQSALAQIQQDFAKNIDVIQANVKSLDTRISSLKK